MFHNRLFKSPFFISKIHFSFSKRSLSRSLKNRKTLSAILLGAGYFFYQKKKTDIKLVPIKVNDAVEKAMCTAAYQNDTQKIKQLISKNIDVNSRHPLGWAPLHVACVQGNYDAARALLELGADPDILDTYHIPKTHDLNVIENAMKERSSSFSTTVRPSASTIGFTPLHYACFVGNEAIIQLLIEYNCNPNLTTNNGRLAEEFFDKSNTNFLPNTKRIQDYRLNFETIKSEKAKELRKKFPLEQRLHEAIVGQVEPINAVASAIRRRENGWHDEDRPLVFLFLGSSGVGKTELAKQVANYLHRNKKEAFIKIDMSEFQTKHEVSKFLGSPPGYVGYDEGGQLTEKLDKYPDAVVLLDEVEKAHSDVLTIMLQVFDEGRLTDGKGKTINCRNATFIMTSNLAQHEIADEAEFLRAEAASKSRTSEHKEEPISLSESFSKKVLYPILRGHFKRDEFLGRINEILVFLPFNETELHSIVDKELKRWADKAHERHSITLTWSQDVIIHLANGYDMRYGARSIKHEVEKKVVNKIAKAHEKDEVGKRSKIDICVENGDVKLNITHPPKSKVFQLFG